MAFFTAVAHAIANGEATLLHYALSKKLTFHANQARQLEWEPAFTKVKAKIL